MNRRDKKQITKQNKKYEKDFKENIKDTRTKTKKTLLHQKEKPTKSNMRHVKVKKEKGQSKRRIMQTGGRIWASMKARTCKHSPIIPGGLLHTNTQ